MTLDVRSRPAFTLIELLVTISIIILLVAILMPSLAGARTRAHLAASLINLQQIGIAHDLYAMDYKGRLVYARFDADNVPPLIGSNLPTWAGVMHQARYVSSIRVFWSPARDTSALNLATMAVNADFSDWYFCGYGVNQDAMPNESSTREPMVIGQASNPPPGRMISTAECWWSSQGAKGLAGSYMLRPAKASSFSDRKLFNFNGAVARVYFDGHAVAGPGDAIGWAAEDNPYDGNWTYVSAGNFMNQEPWFAY